MGLILKNSLVCGTCAYFSLIMGIIPVLALPPPESLFILFQQKKVSQARTAAL